ncbi:alpha/beta hydrolase [Hufsiella ginkgonis]|uniref:DUF1023 domain-containing protein n=1 Tax=Hufsiella ginkgonis TaxID=2695274 RepID=A0A7K1Y3Z5_9SPHI|nr:alpha/beta hydrolase [Hufsiella ginkgonis]MXV18004.1 hypothetical protein [Hufsiella ginkgonis]
MILKTIAQYQKELKNKPLKEGEQFNLVGYSYGSVLQAQAALKLAKSGQVIDNLVLIGSPISTDSDLYKQLSENGNIKSILRYDLPGDALSNSDGIMDILKGAWQSSPLGSGDNAHHFDAARPGKDADKTIDAIVKWLKENGVKN